MNKSDYVQSQGQTREHHCHWPGCLTPCPPAMWGCKRHWFRIPADLRREIWRTFEPGQEVTGTPSKDYVEAARAVQDWIAQNEAAKPKQQCINWPHNHESNGCG